MCDQQTIRNQTEHPPEYGGVGRIRQRLAPVALFGSVAAVLLIAALPVLSQPLPLQTVRDIPLSGGSSRLDYQSLDEQTGLLFVAHLGASLVHVVNIRSNRVVTDIPNIASVHGVLAIPSLGRVYASATGVNQVAVIDEHRSRVIARIAGGGYPDGLAYDPRDHLVFVSDEGGSTDTVIDVRTEQRIATIALGGEAGNTQYDPISQRVFVDVQTRNQLVAIDPLTTRIVDRYPLPGCNHDHSLLLDAPDRLAFVACDGNAKLLVVDMRTMTVVASYSVGADPDVLAFDPGWKRLYVACESGIISVFAEHDRALHKVAEGFVATEAHTIDIDPRTHRLYLPLQDVGGKPVLRVALPPARTG
jgi:DNA-binding beta-propeller fold protein YncE